MSLTWFLKPLISVGLGELNTTFKQNAVFLQSLCFAKMKKLLKTLTIQCCNHNKCGKDVYYWKACTQVTLKMGIWTMGLACNVLVEEKEYFSAQLFLKFRAPLLGGFQDAVWWRRYDFISFIKNRCLVFTRQCWDIALVWPQTCYLDCYLQ